MNSNTFQDQPGQPLSYKFGSLSHTDAAVRRQAIEHNLECLEVGAALGARAHSVWIGDGGNFPGQLHFRRALDRYLDSMKAIYRALPDNWRLFIEHKFYEPAFYSTVLNDWGTSYYCARELGDRAMSLVDLGHHGPNVNVEMIVARLIQFGKLGGFHFNDSQYGDDDLDAGSVKPFQLFLIFNELVDAERSRVPGFSPAYMLDQSHNVTDPIESLVASSIELARAYVQAHLVDRDALEACQESNDPVMALQTLKHAFTTDVTPILATARLRAGGAIDPIAAYRASGYRRRRRGRARSAAPRCARRARSARDGARSRDMIRKAFRMSVHKGQEDEYERRHNPVWQDLAETLASHGVSSYSIFLDRQTGDLFAYVEIESEERWDAIARTDVCRRWWTHMRELMPSKPDGEPISRPLSEVFHL